MNYWLDRFTGTTWQRFLDAGGRVVGFKESQREILGQVGSGDVLLCCVTDVMRWVGALEIVRLSNDHRLIWEKEEFPVRFDVTPLILLEPEHQIPMSTWANDTAGTTEAGQRHNFLALLRRAERSRASGPIIRGELSQKPSFKRVNRSRPRHTVSPLREFQRH
jgi:hypothetical protein